MALLYDAVAMILLLERVDSLIRTDAAAAYQLFVSDLNSKGTVRGVSVDGALISRIRSQIKPASYCFDSVRLYVMAPGDPS
jgi:hypothetical protein